MDWDLFVDESGDFTPGKRCLVGGFICPHRSVNENMMAKWKNEILAVPKVQEIIADFGNWTYDHCRENKVQTNRKKALRRALQFEIVKEYMKRIESIGGKIVIFDNASGSYNIDNTTNFLTVMAKGLMALYFGLQSEKAVIHLHLASRKNITYADFCQDIPISPTRVTEPGLTDTRVILAAQYKAQIKNLAFLQGGQYMLNNKCFSSMIDTMEIMEDMWIKTSTGLFEQHANPFTVPCDYICNTLINVNSPGNEYANEIERLYHSPSCLFYNTDQALQMNPNGISDWNNETDNGMALLNLISMQFPEPATGDYFRGFNADTVETQKTAINYVVSPAQMSFFRQGHNSQLPATPELQFGAS